MKADVVIDKTDFQNLKVSLLTLRDGGAKVIRLATNEMLTGVVTDSATAIAGKTTLTKTVIRKAFKLNKMTTQSLSADVDCRGNPLGLIHYSARQTNKGITVTLLKGGARDLVRHAFIATMKSGHRGVFWRRDRVPGSKPKKFVIGKRVSIPPPAKRSGEQILKGESNFQLPIHELYGPRVPDWFDDDDVMSIVLQGADLRFDTRLDYHTKRLLDDAR